MGDLIVRYGTVRYGLSAIATTYIAHEWDLGRPQALTVHNTDTIQYDSSTKNRLLPGKQPCVFTTAKNETAATAKV